MPETPVLPACPLCGAHSSIHFDTRQFRGQEVTNRLCTQCGLVFQYPVPSESELQAYYTAEYRRTYQGSQGPVARDIAVQRARAESLIAFGRPLLPRILRHLDIGCSAGMLLQAYRGAYLCASAGIEPGNDYRSYARQRGLEVYASLEELERSGAERFDLISLAHVLEHIPDPAGYLTTLRQRWLTPAGHLLIEVPNLYAHDSFETAHLIAFSSHTLRQVLNRAGFQVVRLEQHGRPRSQLIPLYITVLANSAAQPTTWQVQPEHSVALKRRAGMLWRRLLGRLFPDRAWLPVSEENQDT